MRLQKRIMRLPKYANITPVVQDVHWLLVWEYGRFKLCLLVGDANFQAAARDVWNELPAPLRQIHSKAAFKGDSKTRSFNHHLICGCSDG